MASKKKIGIILAAVLGIALVVPSIIVDLSVSEHQAPEPPDGVPVLDISSIPAINKSLIESAGYFAEIAPQVGVLVVVMLPGILSMPTEPDGLVLTLTDLVRVIIVTIPSWPALTVFWPAMIAALPEITLAIVEQLPAYLEVLTSTDGMLSDLISVLPELLTSIIGVFLDELPGLLNYLVWDLGLLEIIYFYIVAVPDFLAAFLMMILGFGDLGPEIAHALIKSLGEIFNP